VATQSLQPCWLSPATLHAPLPFDLYSSNGTLLARRGARLDSHSAPVLSRRLFRSRLDGELGGEKALQRLEALYSEYERLTQQWSCAAEDVEQLKSLAGELIELCTTHSDVCVGMAAYLSGQSHAKRHCLAAAIVGILLGCSLGWNDRLPSIARAALTMNLSQLPYHDELAVIRGYLSAIQEKNVRCHPRLSAELLSKSPGTDPDWIAAVAQHHENLDGTGYPLGLAREEILPEARVLRVADTWCALVLQKQGKGKKTPRHALELLSASSRAHLDYEVFLALKKLMGAYPPGTFVRLANRETALVTSWDRSGAMPNSVLSVISPAGEISQEFPVRDARKLGTRVRDYTHLNLAQMSRLPWSRLWSQEARRAGNN
jgi:HD-GYP domain-containing protein (c-di-GMP phosphodiesterase class II)